MKRLGKISFDLALLSFIPVLSWFCLGLIIDRHFINIFTLTYPLQFIYYILKSVFSTGANISKEKDNNKNAVMSGLVVGTFMAALFYGILLFQIDSYIIFMNMDIAIYKTFAIYSVVQLFIQLIFAFILDKLYYEEKNTLANRYSLAFNLLNFIVLIATSLLTKNQVVIVTITLTSIALFTIYVVVKSWQKFHFRLNLLHCIRYDSVELFNNIAFFLIFLFGLSNALEFGAEYALALTFVALITDTQWDTFDAITVTAQIDLSKGRFNYLEHRKHAYLLLGILFSSTLLMFGCLYWFYDLDLKITLIYLAFEIINFLIYPLYRIKTCYLQLEWSAMKTTTNKIVASLLRMGMSFLHTPFCTGIGQVVSSLYQLISVNYLFYKHHTIKADGTVEQVGIIEK